MCQSMVYSIIGQLFDVCGILVLGT